MQIVVLGGSASATPELADALATWPDGVDRRPELDLVLYARSADRLAVVARVVLRLAVEGVHACHGSWSPSFGLAQHNDSW